MTGWVGDLKEVSLEGAPHNAQASVQNTLLTLQYSGPGFPSKGPKFCHPEGAFWDIDSKLRIKK